jgi:hypothetical protein
LYYLLDVCKMKVGTKYEYPDWRLFPTLIENLEKIYGKFGLNQVTDKKMLAVFLGHSGPSGGFLSKLGAMRTYGLIIGRGFVQVSELGKRIAHSDKSGDPFDAVKEAITNIPLWKALYEKYTSKGVELPDEDFWVDLQEIAGLVPDDAKKASKIVRNDYLDDVHYLKTLRGAKTEVKQMKDESKINISEANQRQEQNTEYKEPTIANPSTLSSGELLKGLFEQGAYDLAKQFIDFIENKNKPQKEQSCKEEPKN